LERGGSWRQAKQKNDLQKDQGGHGGRPHQSRTLKLKGGSRGGKIFVHWKGIYLLLPGSPKTNTQRGGGRGGGFDKGNYTEKKTKRVRSRFSKARNENSFDEGERAID